MLNISNANRYSNYNWLVGMGKKEVKHKEIRILICRGKAWN